MKKSVEIIINVKPPQHSCNKDLLLLLSRNAAEIRNTGRLIIFSIVLSVIVFLMQVLILLKP